MSSGGWSQRGLDRMGAVLADHVARHEATGLVAAVRRRGETHVEVHGLAEVGGAPMRRDTIFRLASVTKPIVAAGAMILVEDCRLRLDDPVDGYLPELADRRVLVRPDAALNNTVAARRPITLRDLLTFRAGFGLIVQPGAPWPIQRAMDAGGVTMGVAPAAAESPDAWMRALGTLPLVHQPGEGWMYHLGADVLGVLIERAAQQPLETFLRERLFAPLGMSDTAFCVTPSRLGRFASAYTTNPANGGFALFDDASTGRWSTPPGFASGGGGLVSTVDDLLAFGQMMLDGGRGDSGRVLSRPSIELMTSNQITASQMAQGELVLGANRGWGFGLSMSTARDHAASVGAYGWNGGVGTSWANDPREALVGVLLTQTLWTSPAPPKLCRDFWTLAYGSLDD